MDMFRRCCATPEIISHTFFMSDLINDLENVWKYMETLPSHYVAIILFQSSTSKTYRGYPIWKSASFWIMWRIWKSRCNLMFQNNIIYQNVIMEAHSEGQKWINDTTKPTSELQYEGEPVTWSSPDNEDKNINGHNQIMDLLNINFIHI